MELEEGLPEDVTADLRTRANKFYFCTRRPSKDSRGRAMQVHEKKELKEGNREGSITYAA